MAPSLSEWFGLVAFLAVTAIAAFVGGRFTASSLGTWYDTLAKPAWTPPGALIGAVWTVLYVLMAVAAWFVWRSAPLVEVAWPLALFAVQLALNVGWSATFFGARRVDWGLAEIVVLWFAILATALAFSRFSRTAAALLVPYLLWVAFASYLNFTIWRLNRVAVPTG